MLKLLDYDNPNPFGCIIGRRRHIAWPVNAYRVTLPRTLNDGNGLNPFERVILKLLDAVGAMDAYALAYETCIPLDLVKSILLRLQDKALIDEHNTIIRQDLDKLVGEEEQATVFVTALLFRELASGKILPFLHWLDDTNPLRKKEGEEKHFHSIRGNDAHKKNMPTQRDVINVLRAMMRQSAAYGRNEEIPPVQQVRISNSPETYLLDCPIGVQKTDAEFRIADPFGNGFSLIFEKVFEQLLEQDDKLAGWLLDWKQSLRNSHIQKQDKKLREPFDSESNLQRYPKLIANLRPSRNTPFRSIGQIFASIEWALFYACCHRPFESVISRLKFTEQAKHSALLAEAAKTIGLVPSIDDFRPIREGKLREFVEGGAYLETVLAIALLQAQGDASHPLCRIASARPDLISRLSDINAKHNEKGHGKGGADAQQQELTDEPFMREIIHALVPDIAFADTPAVASDKDARADTTLDARVSVQGEFGFKLFNRFGANLQDRLVHAESLFQSCKDVDNDALAFVCDLYAVVQSTFEMILAGRLPPDASDAQLISVAENKVVSAGLCAALPASLRTVKPLAVRQALQGGRTTLGACVLALLLVSDDDALGAIKAAQPSFVNDMASIITRRGHGNEPLPLPKNDIAKLRKSAFATIKTLME